MLMAPAVLAAIACHPAPAGSLTPAGYQHDTFKYKISKPLPGFLGDDWKLDNYYKDEDGSYAPKHDGMYLTTYHFDVDDDGKVDYHEKALTYDLRLQNKKHEAFIWLRTVPISNELKDKELRVLLKDYVDGIAGAGYEAVQFTGDPQQRVVEKRFAAEIVEQGNGTLAGQDAYVVKMDVANIDQLKVSPNSRRTRVELVFARTGFEYRYDVGAKPYKFPVLMMAGYANFPDDFATDEAAFQKFLGEIEIRGKRGFETKNVTGASPASSAAPASPASSAAPATSAH
jgi:hypothetical protein